MPGVRIGNGAIIGARSVVSKDIPPYSVACGNPVKVVKMRFDAELIELLEQLQWWNYAGKALVDILPVLCSSNLSDVKLKIKHILNQR